MDKETCHGLWRASANERVAYTDDFPAALLVTPEFWDGCIGQGQATQITTSIKPLAAPSTKWLLTVRDNGKGITNERRLLSWAASHATSNIHRNGHGLKKTLTKYAPDYETASWTIRYRRANKNITVIYGPFRGPTETRVEEDEADETSLMPSGTEINVEFDPDVLGRYKNDVETLTAAFRELICTRYSEDILDKVEFILDITAPAPPTLPSKTIVTSSKKNRWHSFQWHVEKCVEKGEAKKIGSHTEEFDGGHWDFTMYLLTVNGSHAYSLKKPDAFPNYGKKNQTTSRMFAALDGRMIEAMPIYSVLGGEQNHNNWNGMIWFLNFVPNSDADHLKLPTPATTKVSFYENCAVFKGTLEKIRVLYKQLQAKFEKEEKRLEAEKAEEERKERLARAAEEEKKKRAAEEPKPIREFFSKKPVAKPRAPTPPPIPQSPPASVSRFLTTFHTLMKHTPEMDILEKISSAPTTEDPEMKKLLGYLDEITDKLEEWGMY